MEVVTQKLDDILASLRSLAVDWRDDVAHRVIARIQRWPAKQAYGPDDILALLEENFDDALLICRLFLGLSKDQFVAVLKDRLGKGGGRLLRFRNDPQGYVEALIDLGLLDAMAAETSRTPHWSDVLVERLRSGRGSAISGQKRGRDVENFAEGIIRRVFGDQFDTRCLFVGAYGKTAKCDFAIPGREHPHIIIESKGYAATGSKMSDVIGDIEAILDAKRHDMTFLFFTDGLTWKQRKSDLAKIVRRQNNGGIRRIYTYAFADQFESDLKQLKGEYKL
jgi:DpnII restriction endonuclease